MIDTTTTTVLDVSTDEFIKRIRRETARLYSERRMSGDDMRDMAHRLEALIQHVMTSADLGEKP